MPVKKYRRRDRTDLVNEIIMRREAMNKRKLKKSPTVKWLPPTPISKQYQRILVAHVNNMVLITVDILIRNLKSLTEERDQFFPDILKKDSRSDGFEESADRLVGALKVGIQTIPFNKSFVAQNIGQKTSAWNDKQWRKTMINVLGVPIHQQEPWLNPVLNGFTKENVELITKMEVDYVSDVSGVVQRGLKDGSSHRTLARQLIDDPKVFKELQIGAPDVPVRGKDLATKTRNRAKLIARDQVSKLNGQLTMLRETNLGIEKYTWRTADDERVRPSHKANDDKVFNWNEAPATGHPGSDVQCRCHAEPIFDDVIEEILQDG